MTRPLTVVPAEPQAVLAALRDALSGDGPAILPRHVGTAAPESALPSDVPRRVALVVETSGSTGAPKRVALSADALLASAAASETSLGGPGQWLLALPAHYIAGINVLVRSITSGTEPVVLGDGHFDAEVFAEASDAMDAPLRFASLVPTQLLRLLDAAEQDLPVLDRLRRFDRLLVGGQATPPALIARSLELGLNVTRTYGSSETSGGCVYDGVALPGIEVRIVDGEVQLGGSTLAEGYLGDEELTARTFLDDRGHRWYRTGDSGELREGILTVTGRLDAMIKSGGVKVSLAAVERIVSGLPGLADAVAVRSPSVQWGEVPVVFFAAEASVDATGRPVPVPGQRLDEVRAAVQAALGSAARPAALFAIDRIPLLSSGKPDRVALAELAAREESGTAASAQ
ncbi:AMP-binding protein [Parafrigoribacterium soli]|uniref:AMP-binding protein n=1 Tax=Parafrigoribacterium soli TaxID=3144663 RepID=UPI0032EF9419